MYSIDQNSHTLWDALPKVQALARKGYRVRHFIEDIDAAFTALGAGIGSGGLRLARERFHRSGGADWGAALFYSQFLGRQAVDVRRWEPLSGMKTAALARQLGRTVDALFDEFSPGDNWQLIGPSYAGDAEHHRVIADLSVAETAPFVREILAFARGDMLATFPQPDCRDRINPWCDRESALTESLLARHNAGTLVDLYHDWMGHYLGQDVGLNLTSELFDVNHQPDGLLELFLQDYDLAAGLYNESIQEARLDLRPLEMGQAELPFFATMTYQGHHVRSILRFQDGQLLLPKMAFPVQDGRPPWKALADAGVQAVAGKAVILAIQARLGNGRGPLAVPYNGSIYMPASRLLVQKLRRQNLLSGPLNPLVRVRFHFLDRLGELDTVLRLPDYLAAVMGREEVSSRQLAEEVPQLMADASGRLARLAETADRRTCQAEMFPDLWRQAGEMSQQRRRMAQQNPKSPAIRDLWERNKLLDRQILEQTLRLIDRDSQLANLDYWDSRGAIYPWSVAAGGEEFYRHVLDQAEIYEEADDPAATPGA